MKTTITFTAEEVRNIIEEHLDGKNVVMLTRVWFTGIANFYVDIDFELKDKRGKEKCQSVESY